MKYADMNAHEKVAFYFVIRTAGDIIGGLENQMNDNDEDTDEYKEAKEALSMGHDELVEWIYHEVMRYADKGTARHMRFAGTEFIKERISKRLKKWGY